MHNEMCMIIGIEKLGYDINLEIGHKNGGT
jgi:hypothetical protein